MRQTKLSQFVYFSLVLRKQKGTKNYFAPWSLAAREIKWFQLKLPALLVNYLTLSIRKRSLWMVPQVICF